MIGNEEHSPTRQAWLDGLKKGDKVVIRFCRSLSFAFEYYEATVDLTARIGDNGPRKICVGGKVFSSDGKFLESHILVEPTAEVIVEVETNGAGQPDEPAALEATPGPRASQGRWHHRGRQLDR